jgi:uncharacterized protein
MAISYRAPGVYVEEVPSGARPITPVGLSTPGFAGETPDPNAYVNVPMGVNNWTQFQRLYAPEGSKSTPLSHAVFGFFLNGGGRCYVVNCGKGAPLDRGGQSRSGLRALEQVEEVGMVVAPGFTDTASYEAVISHCEKMRDRVAILDAPQQVSSIEQLTKVATSAPSRPKEADGGDDKGGGTGGGATAAGVRPRTSEYAALYYPWITVRDPLSPSGDLVEVPPSGHMAGIWARSDSTRGVHKAPANEALRGALNVGYRVTRDEQQQLNDAGVNCIRFFEQEGIRVWGARTLAESSSPWRYLNVRRLFIVIEKSIARSTNWIVFEPNDQTLWKSVRRDVSAFLTVLWRDGALMGRTAEEAFFVKCDDETNTSEVIDLGMVVTLIGAAPVKPAEFVVFRISQLPSGATVEAV